jgi:hypothetical protein
MLADAHVAVDDPTALLVKPFQFAALLERVARLADVEQAQRVVVSA